MGGLFFMNGDDLPEEYREMLQQAAEQMTEEELFRACLSLAQIPEIVVRRRIELAKEHHCGDPNCARKSALRVETMQFMLTLREMCREHIDRHTAELIEFEEADEKARNDEFFGPPSDTSDESFGEIWAKLHGGEA